MIQPFVSTTELCDCDESLQKNLWEDPHIAMPVEYYSYSGDKASYHCIENVYSNYFRKQWTAIQAMALRDHAATQA